jgi:hypothetical protein
MRIEDRQLNNPIPQSHNQFPNSPTAILNPQSSMTSEARQAPPQKSYPIQNENFTFRKASLPPEKK